ncbi:MAG: hypothetical protein OYH77_00930 [Pseudomonadota bacterium]|nr:hypothetical protein [Pseudomonadota bacterium]
MKIILIALSLLSTSSLISRPQHGWEVEFSVMSVDMGDRPLTTSIDFVHNEAKFGIFSGARATLTIEGKLSWEKKFKLETPRKFNSRYEMRQYLQSLCQDDGESVGKAKFVSKSGEMTLQSDGYVEKPRGSVSVIAYRRGVAVTSVSCD